MHCRAALWCEWVRWLVFIVKVPTVWWWRTVGLETRTSSGAITNSARRSTTTTTPTKCSTLSRERRNQELKSVHTNTTAETTSAGESNLCKSIGRRLDVTSVSPPLAKTIVPVPSRLAAAPCAKCKLISLIMAIGYRQTNRRLCGLDCRQQAYVYLAWCCKQGTAEQSDLYVHVYFLRQTLT